MQKPDVMLSGWGQKPAPKPAAPQAAAAPEVKALEDAHERHKHDAGVIENLMEENRQLQARVNDLEAQLAGAVPYAETGGEQPLEPQPGLPIAPGSQPTMRDILKNAGPALDPEPDPEAELAQLRARAAELGINVDMRWGYKRLAREIAAAEDR